ncbi:hypothetical protein EB796_022120 [Bugula neritina]|uniref:Uncharacterized protein n=1 Tax=Bugula neritina TaxID=10212 RepID=A0A7J7J066_BUGNE|nr:hypothetical protein EB796_022120 [Bugula neritina]
MASEESVHRLDGSSGIEKGGLVIMKKTKNQQDEAMAPPKASLFGLDKLASQKRKEADANEVESKKSRSGGKSDKSSRYYRERGDDTPSHPGGVSTPVRDTLRKHRDKKTAVCMPARVRKNLVRERKIIESIEGTTGKVKDPTGLVAQRGSVELGSGRKLLQGQVQLVTLLHLTFIVKKLPPSRDGMKMTRLPSRSPAGTCLHRDLTLDEMADRSGTPVLVIQKDLLIDDTEIKMRPPYPPLPISITVG